MKSFSTMKDLAAYFQERRRSENVVERNFASLTGMTKEQFCETCEQEVEDFSPEMFDNAMKEWGTSLTWFVQEIDGPEIDPNDDETLKRLAEDGIKPEWMDTNVNLNVHSHMWIIDDAGSGVCVLRERGTYNKWLNQFK